MTRKDGAWKEEKVAKTFLTGVRGGIPFAAEQAKVLLRLLGSLDRPITRFIDLGCGDGALAAVITENYPAASGTLVDFSAPMLEQARKRFEGAGNVKIVEGDFGSQAWVEKVKADSPFDAIVSGFAIHHQNDRNKKRIYTEALSLLAPGGLFLNLEHVASRSEWGKTIADEVFIDSVFEYNRKKGTEGTREDVVREFFERPDKDANQLTPVEVQCEWLRDAGFIDVDCFFKAFELAIFGGKRPPDEER